MKDIITALKEIKARGSFCGKRTIAFDDLHLEIIQYGPLKFPLSARSAKALIKQAKPAKFGWREKTILDKTVRNAWEIPKNRFKIEKNSWNKALKSTLWLLKNDLGLPESAELKASLHNLLIYEPGQFFSPHQDSEKLEGMVATLVVILPSKHSGGSLIIDHQGEKKTFPTSRFPLDKLTFIAFYADCHHEVKAVKEGYRLALTYNLILEKKGKQLAIKPPKLSNQKLAQSLQAYFSEEDSSNIESANQDKDPQKLIYLLDHSYTQKGLSWNHLKNGDHGRAQALKTAADALNLEIYIALADIQETWNCDVSYNYHHYRYRNKYYYDNGNEEESDNIELIELIDSNTVLQHWLDSENKALNYRNCHVSFDQLCWTKASNEFEPFESQFEGWMGNYGNTMDRWYHRAAIILWRKKDHYPVLFEMDPWNVIDELLKLTKMKSQETRLHQIIHSLLPCWSEFFRGNKEKSLISAVFKLALYVKDSELANTMVIGFDIHPLTPATAKIFLSLQDLYGTTWCLDVLNEWIAKDTWSGMKKCQNISEIIGIVSENKSKNNDLPNWLLAYQLEKIQEYDASSKKHDSRIQFLKDTPERISDIIDFVKACIIIDNHSIHYELINHVVSNTELYPALDLIKILYYLEDNLNSPEFKKFGYQKLINYIFKTLKDEFDQGVRRPDNWSIKENLSCSCADCIILTEFLQSNLEKTKIWPLAKERRAHLHQKIDELSVPVTHHTERTGSPHRLILTKTDALHHQAKHRFARLQKELSVLANKISD